MSDERMNAEHRRDVAVAVLQAIDVDEYLIDAVRKASPDKAVGEPAKPPVPPEPKPTDDLVLLDDQDRPITRFLSAWRDWSTGEYVAWEHLDWPLRVYVPKPSPKRIEELAVKYAKEEYGGGCTVHMAIVRAIREAFGGEQ